MNLKAVCIHLAGSCFSLQSTSLKREPRTFAMKSLMLKRMSLSILMSLGSFNMYQKYGTYLKIIEMEV